MATLQLKNIHKSFKETNVIRGVDLDIKDKEFVVFVGPSGCGKSTLLRMIAGLEDVTSGEILIDDELVNDLPPIKRKIAMVFQSYALYPHMTVFDNIAFPLNMEKRSKSEIKAKVEEAAESLKLTDRLTHKPGQLSGGQRQRVAIGRAIVRKPKIFLFDEPLSNLDAALRIDMRLELQELHERLQSTMIYVTHDQVEAMTMADKIVVLKDGIVEQVGSSMELYHHPADQFVATFIGAPAMNLVEGTCTGTNSDSVKIRIDDIGEWDLPVDCQHTQVGEKLTLGIRPENAVHASGECQFQLKLGILERLGSHTVCHGTIGATPQKFCAVVETSDLVKTGEWIDVSFNAGNAYLFNQSGQALKRLQVPISV